MKKKNIKITKTNELKVIVRNPITKEKAKIMILNLCKDLSAWLFYIKNGQAVRRRIKWKII